MQYIIATTETDLSITYRMLLVYNTLNWEPYRKWDDLRVYLHISDFFIENGSLLFEAVSLYTLWQSIINTHVLCTCESK